jgi:hypothetical protein
MHTSPTAAALMEREAARVDLAGWHLLTAFLFTNCTPPPYDFQPFTWTKKTFKT